MLTNNTTPEAAAIVPAVATVEPIAPAFSANLNTDDARKAAAKASLAAKTGGKRTVTAKPAANKRVVKPTAKRVVAVKPTKPSKPAASDRSNVIANGRTLAAKRYNGLSLTVRGSTRVVAATKYTERHAHPIQRTDLAHVSVRDESALLVMLGARTAGFDPAAHNIDLGTFSRLCSVGYIKPGDKAGSFMLTPAGASHARKAKAAIAA